MTFRVRHVGSQFYLGNRCQRLKSRHRIARLVQSYKLKTFTKNIKFQNNFAYLNIK